MSSASRARLCGCTCLLVLAVTAAGRAQVFRSGVTMVALSVTVTDAGGHSVNGLTANDFAVFEDGVQQPVSMFGSDRVPLDVAIALDTSASMLPLMPVVKSGARSLLSRLREGDRATLIDIKRDTQVRRDLTSDLASVAAAIEAVEPSGATALYDGLYVTLRQLAHERRQRPELRRQALVAFSDGLDTSSRLDFDEIAKLARSADVTVYTITPDNRNVASAEPRQEQRRLAMWELRTLARDSGGVAFFPWTPAELTRVYDTIARELVNQYAVGYVVPRPEDTRTFRRVSVRLMPPAQGVARTRAGYAANFDDAAAGGGQD